MKTRSFRMVFGVLALGALLCVSCSEQGVEYPQTYPVSIKIVYNGEPVQGATVTLVPKETDVRGASGLTDAGGVAAMGLPGLTDGAMPGEYWVGVSKVAAEAIDPNMTAEEFYASQEDASDDPVASAPQHVLPQRYIAAQSSGLECVVTEEPDQFFEFELTD